MGTTFIKFAILKLGPASEMNIFVHIYHLTVSSHHISKLAFSGFLLLHRDAKTLLKSGRLRMTVTFTRF